jgi:dTDP-4-amino-4,6-dideoxygalactose transaminase
VSDALSLKVVSLPMHPYLDRATQDRIIGAVLTSAAGEA